MELECPVITLLFHLILHTQQYQNYITDTTTNMITENIKLFFVLISFPFCSFFFFLNSCILFTFSEHIVITYSTFSLSAFILSSMGTFNAHHHCLCRCLSRCFYYLTLSRFFRNEYSLSSYMLIKVCALHT